MIGVDIELPTASKATQIELVAALQALNASTGWQAIRYSVA